MQKDETKKIVMWDELAEFDPVRTKVVNCPALSKKLGREINVVIRAIGPMDLVRAFNFPLDEMNKMVFEDTTGEDWTKAMTEHAVAIGVDEMVKGIEKTILIALVEPTPDEAQIKKLMPDYEAIFGEICSFTMPMEAAADGAAFRQ